MRKLVSVVVFIATASTFCHAAVAAELRSARSQDHRSAIDGSNYGGPIWFVGGMGGGGMGGGMTRGGGGTGGGMGGTTSGGMGGMTGGGMGNMTGGGMGDMTGRGIGGTTDYSGPPGAGNGPYSGTETTGDPSQSLQSYAPQYYHCVTQHGQCSVSSSPGSLRSGASCTCLFGGEGKIK